MRLKELSVEFNRALSNRYDENESEAIFLAAIEHVLGYRRTDYLLKKTDELASDAEDLLLKILHELLKGRPLQYVVGQTIFYGLTIEVNESVLIPRPETEELIEWILESVKIYRRNHQLNVLDVGTGSGCIALSLKKHLPDSTVLALDISEEALFVANHNSTVNHIVINTVQADIKTYITQEKFNLIVSNPPYITSKEKDDMLDHVLDHEPHIALFVEDDEPLIFYETIARFALSNLEDDGMLFFEINEHYGKQAIEMLSGKGFKNIELRKDMQGKDRMIRCSRI